MVGAREEVAYLARSENRVTILRALGPEPMSRRELEEQVGIPSSSLSRVLRELTEEYGWVDRTDDGYRLTRSGTLVIERFDSLTDTIETVRTLGDALEYLPVDRMDLDGRHFHDAELLTAKEFDPAAPMQYGVERFEQSATFRCVVRTVPSPYVRAAHRQVLAGDLRFDGVLGTDYVAAAKGSEMGSLWVEIADEADIRCAEVGPEYQLLILDELVHIWVCTHDGEQIGLIESDNPAVYAWAESVFEEYFTDAVPIAQELPA